jgi:hypothetical protein
MVYNTLEARASRWRARAEEIMVRAEAMQDAEAHRMMLELAATYARLAERAEQDGHPGLRNVNIYKVISDMQTQLLNVANQTS